MRTAQSHQHPLARRICAFSNKISLTGEVLPVPDHRVRSDGAACHKSKRRKPTPSVLHISFINYVQNGTKRRCQPAVHNPTANGPVFVIRVPSDIGQVELEEHQVHHRHVDDSDRPVLRGGAVFHEPERPAAVRQDDAGYRSSWAQHDSQKLVEESGERTNREQKQKQASCNDHGFIYGRLQKAGYRGRDDYVVRGVECR